MRFITVAVGVAVLVQCGSFAHAQFDDVLLHQGPDRLFGLTTDTAWRQSNGEITSSLVADDFRLAVDSSACGLNWFGFYGADATGPFVIDPPVTETVRVQIQADQAGLPGDVLWEQTYVDPHRVRTGHQIAVFPIRDEFEWSVALPGCFAATANTTYWISIAQIGDPESRMRWESARFSDGTHANQFPIGAPWTLVGNYGMAFELRRTPEPSTAFALAVGAMLSSRHRGHAEVSR